MKHWLLLLLLLLAAPAWAVLVDGLAAVVDGQVIARSEVDEFAARAGAGVEQWEDARSKALEALIERVLVEREAERLGIFVADSDLELQVAEIRARSGLDAESFRDALEAQGMDYEAYLGEVRSHMRNAKLASRVLRSKLLVDEAALREYYLKHVADYREPDTVWLSHIQLPAGEGAAGAEGLRSRILAGEDFKQIARSVSVGPGAEQGGDMGYVAIRNLSPEVRNAVRDLAAGAVSEVLELKGTYHLFYVADRKPGRIPDFEEVVERIRTRFLKEREEELYQSWIESLKEKARIDRKI